MGEIVEHFDAIGREGREFVADAVLLGRVEREQIAQPEHQPSRGLEARDEHGRALIADFGRREPFT